jgi:hypothetical protein
MPLFFQGDVCIESVENVLVAGQILPRSIDGAVVLAEGEVTGHRHALRGDGITMFRDDALAREIPGGLYIGHLLITRDAAELTHQEHDTIVLPRGTYRIRRQREFDAPLQRVGAGEVRGSRLIAD